MRANDFSGSNRYYAVGPLNAALKKSILIFILVLLAGVVAVVLFNLSMNVGRSSDTSVADFRTAINEMTEVAVVIEEMRAYDTYKGIGEFGSIGKGLTPGELNNGLKTAMLKIADDDNDGRLSEKEITDRGIRNIDTGTYKTELNRFQFVWPTYDRNLEHYVVITKGEYAGTILYNGSLKFVDSNNRTYFGIELYK